MKFISGWLTFIYPAAIVLLWTILVRVFPSILSGGILKRIEHRYDRKLEEAKAELQASYSTLKTSVDFLSATQPELRSKMIESVEMLWSAVLSLEKEYRDIIFLESICLPIEITDGLRTKQNIFVNDIVQQYQDNSSFNEKLERTQSLSTGMERLFVGDRLWLIYDTIFRVYGRFGILIQESTQQNEYVSWQNDSPFLSILEGILPNDITNDAKKVRLGGLRRIIAYLQAEFLKEAARVMSGSQAFAETLSDLQATQQNELRKMTQEKPEPSSL